MFFSKSSTLFPISSSEEQSGKLTAQTQLIPLMLICTAQATIGVKREDPLLPHARLYSDSQLVVSPRVVSRHKRLYLGLSKLCWGFLHLMMSLSVDVRLQVPPYCIGHRLGGWWPHPHSKKTLGSGTTPLLGVNQDWRYTIRIGIVNCGMETSRKHNHFSVITAYCIPQWVSEHSYGQLTRPRLESEGVVL